MKPKFNVLDNQVRRELGFGPMKICVMNQPIDREVNKKIVEEMAKKPLHEMIYGIFQNFPPIDFNRCAPVVFSNVGEIKCTCCNIEWLEKTLRAGIKYYRRRPYHAQPHHPNLAGPCAECLRADNHHRYLELHFENLNDVIFELMMKRWQAVFRLRLLFDNNGIEKEAQAYFIRNYVDLITFEELKLEDEGTYKIKDLVKC